MNKYKQEDGTWEVDLSTKARRFLSSDSPDHARLSQRVENFQRAVSLEIQLPFEVGSDMYKRLWNVAANTSYKEDLEETLDITANQVACLWINLMLPSYNRSRDAEKETTRLAKQLEKS